MTSNQTCEFEYQQIVRSEAFRTSSLLTAVLSAFILSIGMSMWYVRRKSLRLINRAGSLVLIGCLGYLFFLLGGPVWRAEPTYLQNSCVLENFFYFAALPTMFWPLIVRILLWANKIKLNYAIAGIVATNGLARLKMDTPQLRSKIFRASLFYGIVLCVSVLGFFYLLIAFLLIFVICPSCENFALYSMVILLVTTGILFVLAVYILFKNRKAPDNFYIRREVYVILIIAGTLGVVGFVLSSYDVLGFRSQVPSEFDWIILTEIGFIFAWMITVPYQVVQSYFDDLRTDTKEHTQLSLGEILKTDRGKKIFELFLATDLSVENILFYNAVTSWKEAYDADSPETLKSAIRIVDKYLSSKSYLEINVGQRMKQKARRLVAEAQSFDSYVIPLSVFDDLANEVYNLMSCNSLPRFRDSDFYLLYFGEILPEMIPWLHFTGVSYYTAIRATEMDSSLSLSAFRSGSPSELS